jgi:hypothetical protein
MIQDKHQIICTHSNKNIAVKARQEPGVARKSGHGPISKNRPDSGAQKIVLILTVAVKYWIVANTAGCFLA